MADVLRERILIILSDDVTDENVLAVLAALQAFERSAVTKNAQWNKPRNTDRQLDFKMYIVGRFRYHFLFQRCLKTLEGIYTHAHLLPKEDFTFVCYLEIARAAAIAKGTDKPLALALGIVLGCESDTLPDVEKLNDDTVFTKAYRLIADVDLSHKVTADYYYVHALDTDLEMRAKVVFNAKAVVGYSSFETYLACALSKPVLEIQTNPLLYKFNNKHYRYITDPSTLDQFLDKGVQQCLALVTDQ